MNEVTQSSLTKVCSDCGESKRLTEFAPDKRRKDGRGSYCRDCFAVRHRERQAARQGRTIRPRREVPDGHRYCPECGQVKSLEDFPRNKSGRRGRGGYCKPCHNARGKATYERLYGSTREYHLRRRYGITGAEVDAMVEAQGGTCAVCPGKPEHVDHDHASGRVRGVLCFNCNQALGNVRDDPDVLHRLVAYLGQHGRQPENPPEPLVVEITPYRGIPIEIGYRHAG